MNFSTAAKVLEIISASDSIERERGENRDKIAKGINGFPPLSADEAKKMGLKININWLEEAQMAKQACLQYFNAFQSRNYYFTVNVPSMPEEKRTDWCHELTRLLNKPLKASRPYSYLFDQRFASVVAHGIAPQIWRGKDPWLAEFVALSDLRVPTDTLTSLENLCWFGVRTRYTIYELVDRVFGKYADKGWNRKAIIKILAAYWDKNWESVTYDWETSPEKMTQLVKQNSGFYASDAVPVITLWHFYHLDDDKPQSGRWVMKVVTDKQTRGGDQTQFLFDSPKPVADKLEHLLHIQFGDLNGTPPYLFHAVRSLGFLLHETCFWMNLFRCRLFQHTWENFNLLWRASDGSSRARAQYLELMHRGYVPNEVTFVPREQRHQINEELVQMVMNQARQLMGEVSSSYTQDVDTGTNREQTLGEAQIKLQQSNALMTGLLAVAARNETHSYREIARRFCNRKSLDPDVRAFWKDCRRAGIPAQYLDVGLWEITPDMPLGSGNQTLELAQAAQLMSVRAAHGPDAQNQILHIFDAAVTQNPKLAEKLAPVGKTRAISSGMTWATSIFGTLMTGAQAPQQPSLNPIDQIRSLLGLSASVVSRIMQTDNVGKPEEIAGLGNVFAYIGTLIGRLEADPEMKLEAKQSSDALGKLSNIVKGFAQRQQELAQTAQPKEAPQIDYKTAPPDVQRQMEAAAGFRPSQLPPEVGDPKLRKANQNLANRQAQFDQKQQQQQIAFELEQIRKATEHKENLGREEQAHNQILVHKSVEKLMELIAAKKEAEAEPETTAA